MFAGSDGVLAQD